MIRLIYIIVLFLSLGATAGGFLLARRLKESYRDGVFESFFYYVVLMALFGLYGIWGQVVTVLFLNYLEISSGMINSFVHIIPLMGFPFLMVGGYMLVRAGYRMGGRNLPGYVSWIYFTGCLVLLAIFGGYSFFNPPFAGDVLDSPLHLLIAFYLVIDFMVTIWYVLTIRTSVQTTNGPEKPSRVNIYSLLCLLFLILRSGAAILLLVSYTWTPLFILIYFMGFSIPVIYLYARADGILYELQPGFKQEGQWEQKLVKAGISRRESEVVDLICRGKSNQEIADILFISLQTVKDHTHRIYLKLDLRNRAQLMNLFQQEAGKDHPA